MIADANAGVSRCSMSGSGMKPASRSPTGSTRLGVPFAFLTGYGARATPLPRFGDRPKIEKPFSGAALLVLLRNWRRR